MSVPMSVPQEHPEQSRQDTGRQDVDNIIYFHTEVRKIIYHVIMLFPIFQHLTNLLRIKQ